MMDKKKYRGSSEGMVRRVQPMNEPKKGDAGYEAFEKMVSTGVKEDERRAAGLSRGSSNPIRQPKSSSFRAPSQVALEVETGFRHKESTKSGAAPRAKVRSGITPELRKRLQTEAPETLRAPRASEFVSEGHYKKAKERFDTLGHWATE